MELPDGTSEQDVIKAAFRVKAKALHPDVQAQNEGGMGEKEAEDAMAEVTEAYAVLSDEKLRTLYNRGVADLILNDHEEDYFSSIVNKSI